MSVPETVTLRAHDGLRLHAIRWRVEAPRAIVLIVHGFGEHSGRYSHVADFLNRSGYTVYALDYRGHGRSEGQRGYFQDFSLPAADVKTAYDWLTTEEPDRAVYIFGHSQGTLVTLLFVLAYPHVIQGILLSATMLGLARLSPPLVWVANILNTIAPRWKVVPINPATVTRDRGVQRVAERDALNYNQRVSAHMVYQMIHESRRVLARLPSITTPILIMHGTADRLVPPKGSQFVYDAVGSEDRSLIWYDGLYHELCNEPEQDEVLADIVRWLDERTELIAQDSDNISDESDLS